MQNGPVLRGKSLRYAPVASWRSSLFSVVTSGVQKEIYIHLLCKLLFRLRTRH